jgi:microcystin-dependent protein
VIGQGLPERFGQIDTPLIVAGGLYARPQATAPGQVDMARSPRQPDPRDPREAGLSALLDEVPITGAMFPFGSAGTTWEGLAGGAATPRTRTDLPRGAGGWVIVPGDVDRHSALDGTASSGLKATLAVYPGLSSVGFGKPSATGGIVSGTDVRATASGDLEFDHVDADGNSTGEGSCFKAGAGLLVPQVGSTPSAGGIPTGKTAIYSKSGGDVFALPSGGTETNLTTGGAGGGSDGVPIGTTIWWPGSSAAFPAGYLIGDGRELDRVAYADLFAALGTSNGNGDGSTTFNIPDVRGVTARGNNNSTTGVRAGIATINEGQTGGADGVTIAIANLPAHSHEIASLTDAGHFHGDGDLAVTLSNIRQLAISQGAGAGVTVYATGSGTAPGTAVTGSTSTANANSLTGSTENTGSGSSLGILNRYTGGYYLTKVA